MWASGDVSICDFKRRFKPYLFILMEFLGIGSNTDLYYILLNKIKKHQTGKNNSLSLGVPLTRGGEYLA